MTSFGENTNMRKKMLGVLSLSCALLLAACAPQTDTPDQDIEETNSQEASEEEEATTVSTLTGLPVTERIKNQRPLAVMLNNIKEGCPQSGTEEAAIIYEVPVEGRITRLMGIFEDYNSVEKIGSIRSSRDYFVYFAMEYDALYAHFGQATPYVGDLLNSDRVDNISGAVSGIDKPAAHSFYRTSDRKAPHNVYIDKEGLVQDIEKFGYRTEHDDSYVEKFIFAENGTDSLYASKADAGVLYPGGKETDAANGFSRVQARFEYNEEDQLYYRYQYGDKHIDEVTGNQLAVTNVIFQYCHGEVRDDDDYLAFGCHGDNGYKVQVFTGGKMIEGTWSRIYDNTPAQYVDQNGDPIQLNPGKTWICIIWDEYGSDVVIE